MNNIYWRITVIFHNLVERMFDIHSCEDCYRFTNYLKCEYTNEYFCENCAISRAEQQHERNFTAYWEG